VPVSSSEVKTHNISRLFPADEPPKAAYGLHPPESFAYLNRGECTSVSTIDDVKWWQETQEALNVIGISAQEQDSLFKVLAAILWLGNVDFYEQGDKSIIRDQEGTSCFIIMKTCFTASNDELSFPLYFLPHLIVLDFVGTLLGIPPEFLANSITIRQIETKHGARAGTTYALNLNRMQV